MLDVKSVKEVFEIIDNNFSNMKTENEVVSILDAVYRILASDLVSNEDIPGFDRSSVDGYAVISSDTFGASDSLPAQLQIIGEVKMGEGSEFSLNPGQAVYVPTGGELPQNADAMVMIEYTDNFNDGFIYINKASSPGSHVVFRGDDTRVGDVKIKKGTLLRPQDIGVMAAMGYTSISVAKKLRVGIISTGDEIIEISEQPVGSQVRDINSYALYAGLIKSGVEPKLYGIVKDSFSEIRQMVEKALEESEIVLVSGGSSAGTRDETANVIASLGLPGVLVHGIAVKPGKPTILGKVGEKAIVGLPGHPASAYSIYHVFVNYLIDVMSGRNTNIKPSLNAKMLYNYPSNNGREEYVPVEVSEVDGVFYANPIFGKSGMITLLTSANGYVHISRGSEGIDKGNEVQVILY